MLKLAFKTNLKILLLFLDKFLFMINFINYLFTYRLFLYKITILSYPPIIKSPLSNSTMVVI